MRVHLYCSFTAALIPSATGVSNKALLVIRQLMPILETSVHQSDSVSEDIFLALKDTCTTSIYYRTGRQHCVASLAREALQLDTTSDFLQIVGILCTFVSACESSMYGGCGLSLAKT